MVWGFFEVGVGERLRSCLILVRSDLGEILIFGKNAYRSFESTTLYLKKVGSLLRHPDQKPTILKVIKKVAQGQKLARDRKK